jgi:acyl-CoA thioesterase-1
VFAFIGLPARLPRLYRPGAITRRMVLGAGAAATAPLLTGGLSAITYGLSWSAVASVALRPFRRQPGVASAPPVIRPLGGPLTYVAIGASDAIGWGVPDRAKDGWVPIFRRRLPQPATLVNLGEGGTLLREAVAHQLPRAIAAQPDLVTIWLVVNDVIGGVPLEQYKANLDRLLGELREKTKAVIAIGNAPYPPAALDPWGFPEIVKRAVAGRWNSVIAGAAKAHGAVLVDLYRGWPLARHPEFIGPDGLHPTAAGYRTLADTFFGTLHEYGVV